ncbi:hypothetical protein KY289_001227 [Solanum tuberosum]|nr:hypothetical protein KY289_001227 [Solanum tuberosum]
MKVNKWRNMNTHQANHMMKKCRKQNEVNRGDVEKDDIQENIKEISAQGDLSPRHTKELGTGRKHINTGKVRSTKSSLAKPTMSK